MEIKGDSIEKALLFLVLKIVTEVNVWEVTFLNGSFPPLEGWRNLARHLKVQPHSHSNQRKRPDFTKEAWEKI